MGEQTHSLETKGALEQHGERLTDYIKRCSAEKKRRKYTTPDHRRRDSQPLTNTER